MPSTGWPTPRRRRPSPRSAARSAGSRGSGSRRSRPRPAGLASEVSSALAALALSGIVGYDLADGGFFRRELPFDLERIERLQPRLRDARRLVEAGAVRIEATDGRAIAGWVAGAGGVEYRVRSTEDGWRCTCPWYGRHRGDRGPCKHVLAVQLVAADDAG